MPANVLKRGRQAVVASLKDEITKIAQHLGFSRRDIIASNEQLQAEVRRAAEARHAEVLIEFDTEAMLGVECIGTKP